MKALAAEMTKNFGKKLQSLGILVRELTGDMQLTKREIQETQVIISTLIFCFTHFILMSVQVENATVIHNTVVGYISCRILSFTESLSKIKLS